MAGTIVVGVDGGAQARDAIVLATAVAAATGEALELVHAYPYDLLPLSGTVTEVTLAEEMHDENVRATEALRDELAPGAATRVLPDTSPARALHEVCEEVGADLLVLGSTGRGIPGRVVAGETAKAALHHAPCPVLIAPRGLAAENHAPHLRTIGVGFDGSAEALHARERAQALARAAGGRLVLLTVVSSAGDADGARDSLRERVGDHELEVLEGKPADALVARSSDLDVLALGSRGWGPVRRLLLGSTAEHVVRDAGCAVLVVPRGE
jgi:nucleotide-binding universal stress UspA family protein